MYVKAVFLFNGLVKWKIKNKLINVWINILSNKTLHFESRLFTDRRIWLKLTKTSDSLTQVQIALLNKIKSPKQYLKVNLYRFKQYF